MTVCAAEQTNPSYEKIYHRGDGTIVAINHVGKTMDARRLH